MPKAVSAIKRLEVLLEEACGFTDVPSVSLGLDQIRSADHLQLQITP